MTDYSQMSDQEINQTVTCILNPQAEKMALIGDGSCFYDCGPDGSSFYEIPVLDYCNNIPAAWTIIIENNIGLEPSSNDFACAWCFRDGVKLISKYQDEDNNPLRAAMIVFLMMKGAIDAPAI